MGETQLGWDSQDSVFEHSNDYNDKSPTLDVQFLEM